MAEDKVTLERLISGEKIICPQCGKAKIQPFGATADKAHSFYCPNCDFEAHYTAKIDID